MIFRIIYFQAARQSWCWESIWTLSTASTTKGLHQKEANIINMTVCVATPFFLHNRRILALLVSFLPVSSGSVWICMIQNWMEGRKIRDWWAMASRRKGAFEDRDVWEPQSHMKEMDGMRKGEWHCYLGAPPHEPCLIVWLIFLLLV